MTTYKAPMCIRRTLISSGQIKKKKGSTDIKRDEIDIMNIINDKTFNISITTIYYAHNCYLIHILLFTPLIFYFILLHTLRMSTGWNDRIVVLKKTALQIYSKTSIEKINSANLIM